MEQETNVEIDSYILYKPPSGEKYHRRPDCATSKGLPSKVDCGKSTLNHLEMYRVGEVEPDEDELCSNCAERVIDNLWRLEE